MNFDIIQPARFFIGIIKIFGLWRLDNRWERLYRIYAFLLHFVFTFLNTATMWVSFFMAEDLEQFTESLYMSLTETCFVAKLFNLFHFRGEAERFIEHVESIDAGLRSADERKICMKAHLTFAAIGKMYVLACVCVVVVTFAVMAFGSRYVLPYPAWMPFELNSETYWYAYAFQLIGLIETCLCNVSIDALHCYYMHHLSLIYQLIGYRLSRIGLDIGETFHQDDVNRVVIAELTKTIQMHQFVKRITAKSERLTSFPFFMQVLLSALVLCFTGYQLQVISPLDKPGQFIATADFLFVLGIQIFLPCYYAHQVTVASGQLSEALYNSNWVALPKKSRRLVCLYMEFLRDPIYIRSGKFFNIGIPIFGKTINNAYSYFAVLVRMKK